MFRFLSMLVWGFVALFPMEGWAASGKADAQAKVPARESHDPASAASRQMEQSLLPAPQPPPTARARKGEPFSPAPFVPPPSQEKEGNSTPWKKEFPSPSSEGESESPAAQARAFRESMDEHTPRARRKADEITREVGAEDDSPVTALALLRWVKDRRRFVPIIGRWSPGDDIAFYDEILRRFGGDDSLVIRAALAETLILKGIRIANCAYQVPEEPSRNQLMIKGWVMICKPYPKAALPVLDEVGRRFGKDRHPAIRALYVRSLVEKGRVLHSDGDPAAAIAVYDNVVRRFGKRPSMLTRAYTFIKSAISGEAEEPSPAVRIHVIHALLGKAAVLEQPLQEAAAAFRARDDVADPDAVYDNIVRRFGKDPSPAVRIEVIRALQTKARDLEQRRFLGRMILEDNRVVYGESHWKREAIRRIAAVYGEIDRYFGKDKSPEVRREAALALMKRNRTLWRQEDIDADLAVYDDVNRRFGKNDAEIRKAILDILFEAGRKTDADPMSLENRWWDTAIQWFGQDEHRYIRNRIIRIFDEKRHRLLRNAKGNYEAVLALYDEAARLFGEETNLCVVLYWKALLLERQGNFDAAIALYDDIIRRFDALGYQTEVFWNLRKKGQFLERLGRREAIIANCDEIERCFGRIDHASPFWRVDGDSFMQSEYRRVFEQTVEECAAVKARSSSQ